MAEERYKKLRKLENQSVLNRLRQYDIGEDEYEVHLNVYHSEDKRGVPYLTLIIKKQLPEKAQFDLQKDLVRLDSNLCVVFRQ